MAVRYGDLKEIESLIDDLSDAVLTLETLVILDSDGDVILSCHTDGDVRQMCIAAQQLL